MDLEAEIHAINKKLSELITATVLIKERRDNDKKETTTLSKQVDELIVAVNRLNLTMGRKDGIQEGKTTIMKWVWTFFGSLILGWVLWVSTSLLEYSQKLPNDKAIARGRE